jgi:xanthine dehydrogenase small subunit
MISFALNGSPASTDASPSSPVLDLIRLESRLTGTKEGCREGDCGACTVLLGRRTVRGTAYLAVNSCILPTAEIQGAHLVTIEGLGSPGRLTLVQEMFVEKGASQCGFCTPGMVMSITGYLLGTTGPRLEGAIRALGGNLCRCTGYASVRRAAEEICRRTGDSPAAAPDLPEHVEWLISRGILPETFRQVGALLDSLPVVPRETGDEEHTDVLVAGGTDLMVQTALSGWRPKFLSDEADPGVVSISGGRCVIGATTTVTALMESPLPEVLPGIAQALELVSSVQVRNRATVGGNIVNASPIGDLTIILLALGAELTLFEDGRTRTIPLSSFFRGYKILDLAPGGLVREVTFAIPGSGCRFSFEKVSLRKHLDIASVNSAALVEFEGPTLARVAISAGGVAPIPLLLAGAPGLLEGREITPAAVREASLAAMEEARPISDVRGTAGYKRLLLGRLIIAHMLKFLPQLPVGELIP